MSERDEAHEVVKWYTRARRFPQLIGKTPDGARIWGGPYTYTQVIGAVIVLVVGTKTVGIWGQFGLVGNALMLLGGAYGTALVLGRLPVGSRNPLAVGTGLIRALNSPAAGNLGGSPVRIRRPHRAPTRVVISHGGPTLRDIPTAAPSLAPSPPSDSEPDPAPKSARRRLRPRWSRPTPSHNPAPHPTPRGARPVPRPAPALSGVQRLLAASGAPEQEN